MDDDCRTISAVSRGLRITATTSTRTATSIMTPGFWRGYVFSTDHKIIGIQYGFTALCFLLFGFFLMLLMRWQIAHPCQPVPLGIGPAAGENSRPAGGGRDHFAGTLQFIRGDARDDHGLSGDRAAGVRGLRQLRGADDDWGAGHGVSARQHGELPGIFSGRADHVRELFHSRRRGAGGLDVVFAAGDIRFRPTGNCSGSSAWCCSSIRRCWAR